MKKGNNQGVGGPSMKKGKYRIMTTRTVGWVVADSIKGDGWLTGYKVSNVTKKPTKVRVKFKAKHIRVVQEPLA